MWFIQDLKQKYYFSILSLVFLGYLHKVLFLQIMIDGFEIFGIWWVLWALMGFVGIRRFCWVLFCCDLLDLSDFVVSRWDLMGFFLKKRVSYIHFHICNHFISIYFHFHFQTNVNLITNLVLGQNLRVQDARGNYRIIENIVCLVFFFIVISCCIHFYKCNHFIFTIHKVIIVFNRKILSSFSYLDSCCRTFNKQFLFTRTALHSIQTYACDFFTKTMPLTYL